MTFKLANNNGHGNQSGSGLPITVRLEDFAQSGGCAAALAAFPLYPSGPGHQANHWHKSLDAGGEKKKKNMAKG